LTDAARSPGARRPVRPLHGRDEAGQRVGNHAAFEPDIDQLEPAARQAWCGTIFYLSRDGRLDSNIAIRTLFNEGQELVCWAGGGLVADSSAASEYAEQYDKVGAFLECLDALGPRDDGISTPANRDP